MKFPMKDKKGCPLNTGHCLIEVTTWALFDCIIPISIFPTYLKFGSPPANQIVYALFCFFLVKR
jgi:hypothetical protein